MLIEATKAARDSEVAYYGYVTLLLPRPLSFQPFYQQINDKELLPNCVLPVKLRYEVPEDKVECPAEIPEGKVNCVRFSTQLSYPVE